MFSPPAGHVKMMSVKAAQWSVFTLWSVTQAADQELDQPHSQHVTELILLPGEDQGLRTKKRRRETKV